MTDNARKARVVLFGLGTVGRGALSLSLSRPSLEVVGAVVRQNKAGLTLDQVVPGAPAGVVVSADPDATLAAANADVALVATRSPIAEVLPILERCSRAGVDVVCSSEELACPAAAHPEQSDQLAKLASDGGIAILPTGINPGFVFDALPVMLAGAAWNVDRIWIRRSLDASVFGRTVHRSLGIGYQPDEFAEGVATGVISGHIGFAESCRIIGDALGVTISDFEEALEPVIAERAHEHREYTIEPGLTAGVIQRATARAGGAEWIRFDLTLHIDPESVGWETLDRIVIEGDNALDVTIRPGTGAMTTTAARLVNSIPAALRAPPGLYRATDLLPNAPWFGPEISW